MMDKFSSSELLTYLSECPCRGHGMCPSCGILSHVKSVRVTEN